MRRSDHLLDGLAAEDLADVYYRIRLDPDPAFVELSESVDEVAGYSAPSLLADPSLWVTITGETVEAVAERMVSAPEGIPLRCLVPWTRPDGEVRWTQHVCRTERLADGTLVSHGALTDVTERVVAEDALRLSELRYRLLAEFSLDVVFRSSMQGLIEWVSPSVATVLGWTPDDLVGRPMAELVEPSDLQRIVVEQRRIVEAGETHGSGEMRFLASDGSWRWMRNTGTVLRDADGSAIGGVDVLRDIGTEMETRAQLAHEVDHDSLTGLANRWRLLREIELVAADRADGEVVALLVVSLDDLKTVNEALTHTAGDLLLTALADRLVELVGSRSRVARVSGNEFAVVLPHLGSAEEAAETATRLLEEAQVPVVVGGHELETSVSVGLAVLDGSTVDELLRDASLAAHEAKRLGRGRWMALDPELSERARGRLEATAGLRAALAAGEIRAFVQPVVDLATGQRVGGEALARWVRGDGSVVPPGDFLPVAESSGLVVEVDHAVLRDALAHADGDGFVSVNMSSASLASEDLVARVVAVLDETGFPAERLRLEVTETSLVQVTEGVRARVQALHDLGARWLVDDFGTGYSSIAHLRDLPVHGLKLDRSFTADLTEPDPAGASARRLAQALAGLAEGLGLDTVAEGVETEEQAAVLREQGWHLGQGWLYGRPAPVR
jgi:diguanylate cyclase (GGDEF)-like protein/PAS domain S-box-containing protein